MQHKRVTFFQYRGKHPEGRDSLLQDPHGIGLELATFLADLKLNDDWIDPLWLEDLEAVRIVVGKASEFGRRIVISALSEIWEKASIAYKERWKKDLILLWEYPGSVTSPTEDADKVDSLWWDGEKFYYSCRDNLPQEYPRESAQEDIARYYNLGQMWPKQIEACRRARLI